MFELEEKFIKKLIIWDQECFGIFYTKTVDIFFRWCKTNYSIDQEEIKDIVSDFYIKLWDNLNKYNWWCFESFVRTIFRNIIKDWFKKSQAINFSEIDKNDDNTNKDKFEDNLVSDDDVLDFLEKKYKHKIIKQAIEKLDLDLQEILFLKFIENVSNLEISKILWISEENVRKKISRSIKKIKETLKHIK